MRKEFDNPRSMNCQEAPSLGGRPPQERETCLCPSSFVDQSRWVLFRFCASFMSAGDSRGSFRGDWRIGGAFSDPVIMRPFGREDGRLLEPAPPHARPQRL